MRKRILLLILVGILTFNGNTSLASSTENNNLIEEIKDIKVEDEEIKVRNKNKIDIIIPKIRGFKDSLYEESLNNTIKGEVEYDIEEFKREIELRRLGENSELEIGYEIKSMGDILSIEIRKYEKFEDRANGMEESRFYNISNLENKTIEFDDLFKEDSNYKTLLEKIINSKTDKSIKLKNNQEFYIEENGDLILIFRDSENNSKDIQEFRIELDQIRDLMVDNAINEVEIFDKEIKLDTRQDVSIIIPQISGLSSKVYESKLNREIESIAIEDIEKFENILESNSTTGSSELKINYDIKYDGKIKSLIVSTYRFISGEANGITRKDYYNIDTRVNKTLELKDLFKSDTNYKNVINKEINSQINQDKEKYFQDGKGFKSIEENQGFYFDTIGNIMIEFPIGEIGPRSSGTPVFKISNYILKDILNRDIASKGVYELGKVKVNDKETKLNSEMYFSDNGNLMMPLSEAVKELGYKVDWNGETRIVTLTKGNSTTKVSLMKNIYNHNKATIILDEEARSVEGTTYVPGKFFEDVLELEVLVEKTGTLNIKG